MKEPSAEQVAHEPQAGDLEGSATAAPASWTMAAVLALGLGLRLYHYLRDPSMWHDEAALALNVLGNSFLDLLGPLFFSEAAPPLFLWVEKVAVGLCGDSTFALRLVPLLASGAALAALALVARRLLPPGAALWAVLLFACSDRLLWHGCEAKPYAVDVLVAAGLLLLVTHLAARPLDRQLLWYAGLSLPLVFLSYPACFLLGGLALSLVPGLARARRPGTWVRFGLFLAAAGGSFLLLLAGPVQAQRDETILQCWQDVFPCWDRPWAVPGWVAVRLVEVFRYAWEPTGSILAVVAGIGAVGLWRAGQRRLVVFLLAPVALAALASLLGQYPFGASRVMVFAAPAALLLGAAGLPAAFAWLGRLGSWWRLALAAVTLFPVGHAAYRVVWPWPRLDSARAAAFVRARCRPGEAVVGTAWEHDYYFRAGGAVYRRYRRVSREPPAPLGEGRRGEGSRLWLLATGKTEGERQDWLENLRAAGGWAVLEQFEFNRLTVYYLGQPPLRHGCGWNVRMALAPPGGR